jgi:hypothetical protein
MLAWFDEPPKLLAQAVGSLAGWCDVLVYADGAYALTPGRRRRSPQAQYDAIEDTAAAAGIDTVLVERSAGWSGQVEKRDALVRAASGVADWVMPFDADWELSGNVAAARIAVDRTWLDSLLVQVSDAGAPNTAARGDIGDPVAHGHGRHATVAVGVPGAADMRVRDHHWSYSGVKNGRRVALWGTDGEPAGTGVLDQITVTHRCHFRDQKRILRNRAFCEARDRQVVETGAEA